MVAMFKSQSTEIRKSVYCCWRRCADLLAHDLLFHSHVLHLAHAFNILRCAKTTASMNRGVVVATRSTTGALSQDI